MDHVRPQHLTDEQTEDAALLDMIARHRPAWQADALCREYPEISWFPEAGQSSQPAKDVCGRCLVVFECRQWAMEQGSQLQGIWGGLTADDRRKVRSPGRSGRRAA